MNTQIFDRVMELMPPHVDPILIGYRGSHAYGTHIPPSDPMGTDDIDILGVSVSPMEYYLGLKNHEQVEKMHEDLDILVYDVRKFVRLLANSNPNVITLLFNDPKHIIYASPVGSKLIQHRDLFLTKDLYHTFVGYAHGQLKRVERSEYKGYMGSKRKAIVDQYGYDTKHASHLIRLLTMAIEILQYGKMYVNRTGIDAQTFKAIKRGEYTLDYILNMADTLFSRAKMELATSPLPEKVDKDKVSKLLSDIWSVRLVNTYIVNQGQKG